MQVKLHETSSHSHFSALILLSFLVVLLAPGKISSTKKSSTEKRAGRRDLTDGRQSRAAASPPKETLFRTFVGDLASHAMIQNVLMPGRPVRHEERTAFIETLIDMVVPSGKPRKASR
jgi:hypothetical protein